MIVQCPSCASRYRVNDANVPSSGGKITCPSCQHKFIVYPEEQAPAAGGGAVSDDLEDKTSVALRPDLNKLVNKMQQGGQGGQGDDGVAATEVMSGDGIPDFLNARGMSDMPEDGTVEMKNPFDGDLPGMDAMGGGDDVLATEVVSGDMADGLGFEEQKRPPRPQGQAPPAKPLSTPQNQTNRQASQPPSRPPQPGAPNQSNHSQGAPQPPANVAEAAFDDANGPEGPNPQHDGPWKLKTNFGLTYEFPDTKSLSSWLSNREDLDGYTLSGDGENFHALDEWPQISGGGSGGPAQQIPSYQQNASPPPPQPPSGPGAGGSQGGSGAAGLPGNSLTTNNSPSSVPAPPSPSAATGKKIQPSEYRPPSRDGKWNVLLWGIAFLLMLVVGGLCVQLFGVYDIKGEVLGIRSEQAQNEPTVQPQVAPEQTAQGAGEAEATEEEANELDPKIAKEVTRLLNDAKRAVQNNRLQTAAEKLQNAKLLDPKRVEVYEMLATVYGKMGQEKEAETAEAKAGELKAAAQSGGDQEDGEPRDEKVAGEEASKN